MEKNKHSKLMGFLNISGEPDIHTVTKKWIKWIPILRVNYGKAQTFQSYGFFNISGEVIHTIPKICENLIPTLRESIGKHEHT